MTTTNPPTKVKKPRKVDEETTRRYGDEVTFGIEIECALPNSWLNQRDFWPGSYHQGRALPLPFPSGWRAEEDGSLGGFPGRYHSLEIVSPPLKGLQGLQQVEQVYTILNQIGARVNRTCGAHVHVGIAGVLGQERILDFETVAAWIRRLLTLTARHEIALFAITGSKHILNNHYSRSIKNNTMREVSGNQPGRHGYSYREISSAIGNHDSRYLTLNLINVFNSGTKRTVEFRVFRGTLNPIKAVGYILTAIGLAVRAAENPGKLEWDDTRVNDETNEGQLVQAVRQLHREIYHAGRRGGVMYVPREAFDHYQRKMLHNQIWNAEHFAEALKEADVNSGDDDDD